MPEECECGDFKENCDCDEEELSMEDIAESNHVVLNALIDLLVEKKIISEEELDKKIEEFSEEDSDDEDDSDEEDDSE